MKKAAVFLISSYQLIFSPDSGWLRSRRPTCRFFPSCSEYAKQAIMKYGVFKGMSLGGRRLLRCHPWHAGGHDPLI